MGQETGFELLEKFEEFDFHVVFITAHEEFALKAIKFSALDYLIKPVNLDELELTIHKIRKNLNKKQLNVKYMFDNFLTKNKSEHKITLATSDGFEFVKVDDIYHLKADGSYAHFFLKNQKKIVSSKNLKFFESILKEYGFYRIHNSTLVNLKYIAKLNRFAGGSVVMENGAEFSISKSRKDEFMKVLSLK
jgi:two-component system LytT family response regulator